MSVEFKDYSVTVMGALNEATLAVLEEVAGEVESQVKRNQDRYRDTGKTTNSWTHTVEATQTQAVATIGSPEMNAIWEEFGTGEYALEGNGRKGGWFYVDERGKGHFTHGKKPRRHFWNAYSVMKNSIIKRIQDAMKGATS